MRCLTTESYSPNVNKLLPSHEKSSRTPTIEYWNLPNPDKKNIPIKLHGLLTIDINTDTKQMGNQQIVHQRWLRAIFAIEQILAFAT